MPDTRTLRTDSLLLTTAVIWGLAFTAQRAGMDFVGPFTYNAVRFALGTLSLVPLLFVFRPDRRGTEERRRVPKAENERRERQAGTEAAGGGRTESLADAALRARRRNRYRFLRDGIIAGVLLFGGSSFQQVGLVYTTAGKAGFITGLYVVIVPIAAAFLGRRTDRGRWLGATLAVTGLYFLSITASLTISRGDFLVFLSAFFFAAHVLVLTRFSRIWHPLRLAAVQYLTTAALSLVVAAATENMALASIGAAWLSIVYGGVFSVGVAYSLQIIAQREAHPAHAAILLSLEGAFAALGGFIVLGELLSPRDLLGCALMLAGMLASQSSTILRSARARRPDGV
ncbi:MAG: EamA family transporter [Spirochaetes bacterium]|jgi:drug/metabolite transporter (DMT)-like permease|nr:EamA family transporter [Spirochaetota bacterium]